MKIWCISADGGAAQFATSLPKLAVISTLDDAYTLFADAGCMPEKSEETKPRKKIFTKTFFSHVFVRSRTKHYLLSAVFLFVMSYFTFFPVYNLVFSTILLSLGFYSLLNRTFNPAKEKKKRASTSK